MKFVYFGYDFMLPSVQTLIGAGHELIGIMSFECDNVFNFNRGCQDLASADSLPFIVSDVNTHHLDGFLDDGCECFLSAGYPHKIPSTDEARAYALNVHPTYLPYARGFMPIPHIITGNVQEASGFSAHKMTQEFDGGDILLQKKFDLHPRETVESYMAKIALRAPDMMLDLFENLPEYWKNASAQNVEKATHFPAPTDEDRILDFTGGVAEIDALARAFGRFGSIARLGDQLLVVYNHDAWVEAHSHPPGSVVAQMSREVIVAASDGYVVLKEFDVV